MRLALLFFRAYQSRAYLPGDARGPTRRSAELEETRSVAKRDANDVEGNGVVAVAVVATAATETEAEPEEEAEEAAAAEQRR